MAAVLNRELTTVGLHGFEVGMPAPEERLEGYMTEEKTQNAVDLAHEWLARHPGRDRPRWVNTVLAAEEAGIAVDEKTHEWAQNWAVSNDRMPAPDFVVGG